jgi:hypothetical protein
VSDVLEGLHVVGTLCWPTGETHFQITDKVASELLGQPVKNLGKIVKAENMGDHVKVTVEVTEFTDAAALKRFLGKKFSLPYIGPVMPPVYMPKGWAG